MKNFKLNYWLFVLLLAFSCTTSFGQTETENRVVQTVEVKMNDGEKFQGQLVRQDEQNIVLLTKNGEIKLDASKMKYIKDVEPYEGKYSFRNPNDTRYFFGTSAKTLKKGEGYYQNINVLFNAVNVGITDNISIGGGFEFISTVIVQEPLWFLTPKVGFPISEKISIGGGLLIGGIGSNGAGGLGYGVFTYGSADSNFSIGLGYGFNSSRPTLVASGMHRVNNRISLVTENYFVPTSPSEVSSGLGIFGIQGIRIMGEKNSFDIGIMVIPEIVEYIPALPYLSYVATF